MKGFRRSVLILLAPVVIAALLPITADAFLWFGTGQPERFFDEPGIIVFNSIYIAAPFVLLFVLACVISRVDRGYFKGVLPALALAVTGWLWVTMDGYRHQTSDIGGGANIGIAMIMLALLKPEACVGSDRLW